MRVEGGKPSASVRQRKAGDLSGAGGSVLSFIQQKVCTHTRRSTSTAATSRSHDGAFGPRTASSKASAVPADCLGEGAAGGFPLRDIDVVGASLVAFGPGPIGMLA